MNQRHAIWADADGNYFGEGHIDPKEFCEVCLAYCQEHFGDEQAEEDAQELSPQYVTHEWWYQPDPDNDELMHRCDKEHPGAMPFTAWRR